MKNKIILTGFLCFSLAIFGHEFWLEPAKFQMKKGEMLHLRFKVGENFEGENWTGNFNLVNTLKLYFKKITINLDSTIDKTKIGDSLSYKFTEDGTALFAFHSKNKYIELNPNQFLAYSKEDGLENAILYREKHHETDSISREFYQRNVKTLVQIGDKKDDTYTTNCNLPVEFIPLSHPYLINKSSTIGFKLLANNIPLPNYKVKIWHKINQKTKHFDVYTNKNGEFSISVSRVGNWMVSTVKMERIDTSNKANWQSYWASLTWGY
jgi:uncharacterized GH25 family protein